MRLSRAAVLASCATLITSLGLALTPAAAITGPKRGGAWHVASTLTLTLSQTGGMLLILRQATVGLLLRFTATFKGDSFNSGSKAVSKPFEIT